MFILFARLPVYPQCGAGPTRAHAKMLGPLMLNHNGCVLIKWTGKAVTIHVVSIRVLYFTICSYNMAIDYIIPGISYLWLYIGGRTTHWGYSILCFSQPVLTMYIYAYI